MIVYKSHMKTKKKYAQIGMGIHFFSFWSIYGWFLTVYLFSRVLDALRYLNCWGVSQLYDNFPSNTQNYSSGRVKVQTEGEMCKYSQPTKATLQVYYMTNLYSMYVMCESADCESTYISRCVHHRFDFPFTGLQWLHLDVGSYFILHTHIPNSSIARQNC